MERMRVLEKILTAAKNRGISQAALEVAAALPQGRISKIKATESQDPAWSEVLRMAKAVGVSLDFLADDSIDEPQPAASQVTPDELTVIEVMRALRVPKSDAIRGIAFGSELSTRERNIYGDYDSEVSRRLRGELPTLTSPPSPQIPPADERDFSEQYSAESERKPKGRQPKGRTA